MPSPVPLLPEAIRPRGNVKVLVVDSVIRPTMVMHTSPAIRSPISGRTSTTISTRHDKNFPGQCVSIPTFHVYMTTAPPLVCNDPFSSSSAPNPFPFMDLAMDFSGNAFISLLEHFCFLGLESLSPVVLCLRRMMDCRTIFDSLSLFLSCVAPFCLPQLEQCSWPPLTDRPSGLFLFLLVGRLLGDTLVPG